MEINVFLFGLKTRNPCPMLIHIARFGRPLQVSLLTGVSPASFYVYGEQLMIFYSELYSLDIPAPWINRLYSHI